MSAYLILTIAFLPVAFVIWLVLRSFGVDTKKHELGVAMIAGSMAIMVFVLVFYAFIALGILTVLRIVDAHELFCKWHITEANCPAR